MPPPLAPLLERAVSLAVASVADGGGPFGAVVVRPAADGWETVAEGTNRVTATHDPSAHAEVVALRAAGAALGTHDLAGCVLLSSCEPCPMCRATAMWARVDAVWFAADRHDAARAGFDDLAFYDMLDLPPEQQVPPVRAAAPLGATRPFEAWAAHEARVEY
ncbi:nucleoside deaminase [Aquipuribacter nitratireducens]|uniref:Nucleoside deaminase n=1 Tax=Aquipuribacter nitratireducens TaxID=650104 RepID=A0ABW0GNL9_9MICO